MKKQIWKQLIKNSFIYFIFLLISCSDEISQPYKDLEITFPEEDYAEFWIYSAPDSSLVIADEFDREHVQSLHYSTLEKGDFYLKAESGSKKTQMDFYYDGRSKAVVVYF